MSAGTTRTSRMTRRDGRTQEKRGGRLETDARQFSPQDPFPYVPTHFFPFLCQESDFQRVYLILFFVLKLELIPDVPKTASCPVHRSLLLMKHFRTSSFFCSFYCSEFILFVLVMGCGYVLLFLLEEILIRGGWGKKSWWAKKSRRAVCTCGPAPFSPGVSPPLPPLRLLFLRASSFFVSLLVFPFVSLSRVVLFY